MTMKFVTLLCNELDRYKDEYGDDEQAAVARVMEIFFGPVVTSSYATVGFMTGYRRHNHNIPKLAKFIEKMLLQVNEDFESGKVQKMADEAGQDASDVLERTLKDIYDFKNKKT